MCAGGLNGDAGEVLELPVRAVDEDTFETSLIYFTGLQPDPSVVDLPAGVGYPVAMPLKYGCNNTHYSECDEQVRTRVKSLAFTRRVSTNLTRFLTSMYRRRSGQSVLRQGSLPTSPMMCRFVMNGLSDVGPN